MAKEKRKVIKFENTRRKTHLIAYCVIYLMLKETNVPEWVYGMIACLALITIAAAIADLFTTKEVDVFKKE